MLKYFAGPLRRQGCDNRDPYTRLNPDHCGLHNRKVSLNNYPNGKEHFMNVFEYPYMMVGTPW